MPSALSRHSSLFSFCEKGREVHCRKSEPSNLMSCHSSIEGNLNSLIRLLRFFPTHWRPTREVKDESHFVEISSINKLLFNPLLFNLAFIFLTWRNSLATFVYSKCKLLAFLMHSIYRASTHEATKCIIMSIICKINFRFFQSNHMLTHSFDERLCMHFYPAYYYAHWMDFKKREFSFHILIVHVI